MEKISLQELEIKLSDALLQFGLPTKEAHILARESAVTAKARLRPQPKLSPPVTIEDSWKAEKFIRIRIKRGANKDPELILRRYLEKRPKYPPYEDMLLEAEFGGPEAPWTTFLAVKKPKPKIKKDKGAGILSKVSAMNEEETRELIAKLQGILESE